MTINTTRYSNNGYPHFDNEFRSPPALQLNESLPASFLDTVLITQLIHATKSKEILDFGCYLGLLPLLVEDLLQDGFSDMSMQANWTLIDNFEFLKDLHQYLNDVNHKPVYFNTIESKSIWQNMSIEKQNLLVSPPTNSDELLAMLTRVANGRNSLLPKFKNCYSSLDHCNSMVDFISYDLSASHFNIDILNDCVYNKLNDKGIIVLDDVKPVHPQQMAVFHHALNTMPIYPIAFSRGKVALMKTTSIEEKNSYLINTIFPRLKVFDYYQRPGNFYGWEKFTNPVFGTVISLIE